MQDSIAVFPIHGTNLTWVPGTIPGDCFHYRIQPTLEFLVVIATLRIIAKIHQLDFWLSDVVRQSGEVGDMSPFGVFHLIKIPLNSKKI